MLPVLYVLMFMTGDTKGHVSWNVAEVSQKQGGLRRAAETKAAGGRAEGPAQVDMRSLHPALLM